MRVDALPPGPRPISYKVITMADAAVDDDGDEGAAASWANRRAAAHPETPPPMMATRVTAGAVMALAAVLANQIDTNKARNIKHTAAVRISTRTDGDGGCKSGVFISNKTTTQE